MMSQATRTKRALDAILIAYCAAVIGTDWRPPDYFARAAKHGMKVAAQNERQTKRRAR